MKKLTWLTDLQNFAGVVIGLIMVAIGSVMFLNAGAKLYILGYESSAYFSAENQCEGPIPFYSISQDKSEAPKTQKKTPEEMKTCIEKETKKEKKRYTREKQSSLLDGAIMIIVGFPLWFFHRQRRLKEEK